MKGRFTESPASRKTPAARRTTLAGTASLADRLLGWFLQLYVDHCRVGGLRNNTEQEKMCRLKEELKHCSQHLNGKQLEERVVNKVIIKVTLSTK